MTRNLSTAHHQPYVSMPTFLFRFLVIIICFHICALLQIRAPHQICYTRSTWDTPPDVISENMQPIPKPAPLPPKSPCEIHTPGKIGRPPPSPSTSRHTSPVTSANEFASYMQEQYPQMVNSTAFLIMYIHFLHRQK